MPTHIGFLSHTIYLKPARALCVWVTVVPIPTVSCARIQIVQNAQTGLSSVSAGLDPFTIGMGALREGHLLPLLNWHGRTKRRSPTPVTQNLTTNFYRGDKHLVLIFCLSLTNYVPCPKSVQEAF